MSGNLSELPGHTFKKVTQTKFDPSPFKCTQKPECFPTSPRLAGCRAEVFSGSVLSKPFLELAVFLIT